VGIVLEKAVFLEYEKSRSDVVLTGFFKKDIDSMVYIPYNNE